MFDRKEYNKNYQKQKRLKLLCLLGNKCIKCKFVDIRALQIDHKKGGGTKESKRGASTMYGYYLKHPKEAKKKLQVLCANCNWIKKHENNEIIK